MPLLSLTIIIHAPIEICFDLSRSIDMHKISTAQTKEEAIAGVTTGLIGLGEEVTWRAKHLGIVQKLSSRITAFDFPHYFQDTMIKGAFKSITHDHVFERIGSFTKMKDHLYYQSPLGFLGRIADRLFLEKYLTELLEKRNQVIKATAESGEWKKILPTNKHYHGN
jgi:ligand-binding SRPBCC domain-containing protein